MSAFVVGHDHIDALLTFAISSRVSYWVDETQSRTVITTTNAEDIGKILLRENELSVGTRYNETDPDNMPGCIGQNSANYRYRHFMGATSDAMAILKACNCFAYQACEHPEWEDSDAHSIIKAIEHFAIRALPGYCDATGWEFRRPRDAKWA